MHKVLITGITGFLGSHVAEKLISDHIVVVGLKRPGSDIWRCEEFKDQIEWIDIDPMGHHQQAIIDCGCDTIIHGAWMGVEASERDNWQEQIKNIPFLIDLLQIAKNSNIKKFIFLGSQSEYGNINGKVSEDYLSSAINAYGGIKLACLEILKTYCLTNQIDWVWLRIFSIFGEKENSNWLIPSLVKTISTGREMDFTAGEQQYAYLYVKDFAQLLHKIVTRSITSGIYNMSANQCISIRSLIEGIRDIIDPAFKLNFGALNYRHNQSMHIEGDMKKLSLEIGEVTFTDFNVALQDTLNYYINN